MSILNTITLTDTAPELYYDNTSAVIALDFPKNENETSVEHVARFFAQVIVNTKRDLAERYKNMAVQSTKDAIESEIGSLVNAHPEISIE